VLFTRAFSLRRQRRRHGLPTARLERTPAIPDQPPE